MKKTILTLLPAALLLLSSCMGQPGPTATPGTTAPPVASATPGQTPTAEVTPTATARDAMELAALMPDKAGFRWQYSGFAEYSATLTLKSVEQTGGGWVYSAEGEVADMSAGEAKGDFSIKVDYEASPGVLMQRIKAEKALDNTYPALELIRSPLQKGTQWAQAVKDSKGRDTNLDCAITDVKTESGRKVYYVTYKDQGSAYYETREITEGKGVTAFDKLYEYETGSELIGYRYYTAAETTQWQQWLPKLDTEYTFFGLAEYGHKGKLVQLSSASGEAVYEYRGVYADGSGRDDKFVIRYYADLARGTVTEKVISNERGAAEVNSKLHNLVVIVLPFEKGSQWSHQAKLDGKDVTIQAKITDYDDAKGIMKVRYTAKSAAGYYDNTYLEERTFEKGFGLTAFSRLLPGDIGISTADAKDPQKLANAIAQHSFGYTMNKTLVK